jgi:putative component of toxin-antitoxin plasmid stabilization module
MFFGSGYRIYFGEHAAILLYCCAVEIREVKAKMFSRPKPIGRSI